MPDDARAHALLARALIALGDPERAGNALDHAIRLQPASVPVWIERAALARLRGDTAATLEALERLVALAPGHMPFRLDLAGHLDQAGDPERSAIVLDEALALSPRDPVLLLARASLKFKSGHLPAALVDAEAAFAENPANVNALGLTGELLLRLGRAAEALPRLQRAAAMAPGAWVAQDALLRALKQTQTAKTTVLAQAERLGAALGGGFGKAVAAVEHLVAGGPEGGAAAIAAAISEDPSHPMVLWLSMQVPPSMVHDDDAAEARFLANWRDRLAILESLDPGAVDPTVAQAMLYAASSFYVHYLGQPLTDEIKRMGHVITTLAQRAAGRIPLQLRADDGRLRVGIGTGMLRSHTITKLFGAFVRGLDRERFEVTLIHTGATEDEITKEFIAGADAYLRTPAALSDVAREVHARDLDLIVWLDVGMETTGAALAALRLAPAQAVLWGHPVTTGLPSIDVFLTSAAMEPSDGEQHYSERLHRLPGLGTCYAKPDARPTALPNELAGGRPTGVLAFMPQLVQKLRPRFDRALARIASRAPELRLLMTPYFNEDPVRRHRERLGRAFAVEGVTLDSRLAICRWVSQPEWLGLARIADFALDAFDWSGGNTSLEMFWFDTPIVTLPGELMRGRHTMAMLEQMELPQLIARDVDDYVRIAVELATSADFRAEMRGLIRERKHRLYDDRTVVEAFVRFCAEQAATGRERRLARDARLAP
jgi:predicted O-linked N-acetylglucosamine transferase (SPINDLY family)